jgi:molybdate transport system substrate-binding protein
MRTIKVIKYLSIIGWLGINTSSLLAAELHLAVAANFAKPIERINQLFEQQFGHKVTVSLGSTGQLYAQIKNGAPFEIFLSADMERPELLVKEGMAVKESLFTYAVGQLVLWSPQPDLVDAEGKVLTRSKFEHLAIANPKTAPYGAAAKQVLVKKGLWKKLQSKLVQGNDITQTYQFVATGNADLGFIALSQYKDTAENAKGSHWLVPQELYTPITQGAVLLKLGENNSAAKAFIEFLSTPAVRRLIEEFGYR